MDTQVPKKKNYKSSVSKKENGANNKNSHPRLPTEAERKALAHHIAEKMSDMPEESEYLEAETLTARAAISVFDDFFIGDSKMSGKIFLAMWSESINFFGAYLLKDGYFETIPQDELFQVQ